MNLDSKIYIAGHRGLVGSALLRLLEKEGYTNLVYKTHTELDLLDLEAVRSFFSAEKPEYVFLAAARVGGIVANQRESADFLYENLQIQNNVIHTAYVHGVKKLLFLGSSCIYPRECPQPIREEYLLTGPLEPTNEAYAIAKIAGIKLCQSYNQQYGTNFIAAMPTNLYGPNDNFDLENSHLFPALIRKFYEAIRDNKSSIEVWGTGKPRRELMHVDDMARACLFLMDKFNPTKEQNKTGDIFLNVGTGSDTTIVELVDMFKRITGYAGEVVWDKSRPDGTPQKLLNVDKMYDMGWRHTIGLEKGISDVYAWYTAQQR